MIPTVTATEVVMSIFVKMFLNRNHFNQENPPSIFGSVVKAILYHEFFQARRRRAVAPRAQLEGL
jgi:hypothetical protein